ncbi:MAG: hypothetical protein J5873_03445 [Bacteroidales bacterium]|nr:hypothetical protein [Bacteroidales bacterium]
MKKPFPVIGSLLLCLLFAACEQKDFSVNSPKKQEVTIVYGLLDPNARQHYLKIYKGFLTEGSAYEAAKDPHHYSYGDSLEVFMEEYSDSRFLRRIDFDTTTAIAKDSGLFAYPEQLLYTAQAKLRPECRYVLWIKNKYSGKICTAETQLVGDIYVTYPILNLSEEISFPEADLRIKYNYRSGTNAACFEAIYNYYYTEELADGGKRQRKTEWLVGKDYATTPRMSIPYQGVTFYQKVAQSIQDDPAVTKRHTDSIVLHIYKGGEDLYKYMQASSVGTGINQERMLYTNLHSYASAADYAEGKEDQNCIGVFSSKSVHSLTFRDLAILSRDSLFKGRFTGHLKFTDNY